MASSDSVIKPVNGNYGTHHPYGPPEQQQPYSGSMGTGGIASGMAQGEDATAVHNASSVSNTSTNEGSTSVPKDEVGWYFVEQYYTTLSKNPEKLHVRKSLRTIRNSVLGLT